MNQLAVGLGIQRSVPDDRPFPIDRSSSRWFSGLRTIIRPFASRVSDDGRKRSRGRASEDGGGNDTYGGIKPSASSIFKRMGFLNSNSVQPVSLDDEDISSMPSSKTRWLLNPRSKAIRNWDMYVILLLVYTAIVTPFEASFLETKLNALFFINRAVDTSFLIDLCMQFFMPFQDDETIWVYNHKLIMRRYLTGWFSIDVLSIFPFDSMQFLTKSNSLKVFRFIRLLRLAKLLRVLRVGRMFRRWESTFAINYAKLSLVKFVVTVLLIAHWLACSWHVVLFLEDADYDPSERCTSDGVCHGKYSWMTEYSYISHNPSPSPASRYIVSMYWAIATLSTLGYGDVVPTSDLERGFVILSTIGGASVYAYMVGAVCNIISSMDETRARFYRNVDSLNRFLSEKNIDQGLRIRCRDYLRFKHNNTGIEDYNVVIGQMSKRLRGEVAEHLHTKALTNVPFFKGATQDFQIAVAISFSTDTFSRGEYILHQGRANSTMYIISKGLVMCRGRLMGRNRVLGEETLFRSDMVLNYAAVTLTNTVVHSLSCDKLQHILQEFPRMQRRIRQMIVRVIFRDTILDYVKKVKQAMRLGHGGRRLEQLFPEQFLPLFFDHKYAYIAQEDHLLFKDIISSALVIQRYYRGYAQRKKYHAILERQRTTPVEQLKLERIIVLSGMPDTYLQIVKKEALGLSDLKYLSPGCLRAAGFTLSDAVRLLNSPAVVRGLMGSQQEEAGRASSEQNRSRGSSASVPMNRLAVKPPLPLPRTTSHPVPASPANHTGARLDAHAMQPARGSAGAGKAGTLLPESSEHWVVVEGPGGDPPPQAKLGRPPLLHTPHSLVLRDVEDGEDSPHGPLPGNSPGINVPGIVYPPGQASRVRRPRKRDNATADSALPSPAGPPLPPPPPPPLMPPPAPPTL